MCLNHYFVVPGNILIPNCMHLRLLGLHGTHTHAVNIALLYIFDLIDVYCIFMLLQTIRLRKLRLE